MPVAVLVIFYVNKLIRINLWKVGGQFYLWGWIGLGSGPELGVEIDIKML
jgi:hypothetical protein